MKKILISILVTLSFLASPASVFAQSTVIQGGTGTTTVPKNYVLIGKDALHLTAVSTSSLGITSPVTSVFGRLGAVVAQAGDYTTAMVSEVTNLYFTNARAIAATLTGYTSGAGVISATDTVLSAIQKLNGNIAALVTGVSSVSNSDSTLTVSPTTGAVVASLNTSHANTWNAAQIFYNPSTTQGAGTVIGQDSAHGFKLGYYNANNYAIWPLGVTPSGTNYSFLLNNGGTSAQFNSTNNVEFNINDVSKLIVDSAGDITFANLGSGLTKVTSGKFSVASAGTDYQAPITLTTTGSGAATFLSNVLNIPTPSSASVGGASSTVQYNANGAFAGNSGMTYTGSVLSLLKKIIIGPSPTSPAINSDSGLVIQADNSNGQILTVNAAGTKGVTIDNSGTYPTIHSDYFTGSDPTLHLSTYTDKNNTNGFFVIPGGNVGINTATPATALETNGTASSSALVVSKLSGIVKANGTSIATVAVNGTDFTLNTPITCGAGQFLLSASAAGVYGCGTPAGGSGGTSPFATTTSNVPSQLIVYPINNSDILTVGSSSTTTAPFFSDPNSLVTYIKGKLGINTAAPVATLDVQSTANTSLTVTGSNTANAATFTFADTNDVNNTSIWRLLGSTAANTNFKNVPNSFALQANPSGGLILATNSASPAPIIFSIGTAFTNEAMRIIANKNVGIGTSVPTTKLEVNGTASSSALVVSGLSGIMKANGASAVTVAANGTDFTLVASSTCAAGSGLQGIKADGSTYCFTPAAATPYTGTYPIVVTGSVISTPLATTTIQQTYGTAQIGAITLATTSLSFNGLTFSDSISNSGGTFTFTPIVSGTLGNAGITNPQTTVNGQTCTLGSTCTVSAASSTLLSNSNTWSALNVFSNASTTLLTIGTAWIPNISNAVLVVNGSHQVVAGIPGTDYENPLTFSTGLNRTTNAISCLTASGSVFGCLTAADWTTFNSKQSALTFSTGLTNTAGTVTVNTSQNISTLSNLTGNGFVKTSGSTGALSIDTTTYLSGTVAIANGGTGQTSASAAFNALSPLTTAGDILYGGVSGAGTRLAAGTAVQVLHSGTTPSWSAISLTADVSGTLPVGNGGTGITSLGAGIATWLGTPSSANLATAITDETGTAGSLVFSVGPTFTGTTKGANLLFTASSTIGDGTVAGGLTIAGSATTTGYLVSQSTTATSTFAWGIQAVRLNVTSTTASSTFANGIQLSAGCFSVAGVCIGGGAGPYYDYQTFTASGTWTKPAGTTGNEEVVIQVWAGGGSGGAGSQAAGGGGGAFNQCTVRLGTLGATETVTVGAGGVSVASGIGNVGGTTSFGSNCLAYGGGGGDNNYGGGGGGGTMSAGSNGPNVGSGNSGAGGRPGGSNGTASNVDSTMGGASHNGWSFYGGGGGGNLFDGSHGGKSQWGGGGGNYAGGTIDGSVYGGTGGAGNTAGTAPAGGGGGASSGGSSGAGARGEVRVWVQK